MPLYRSKHPDTGSSLSPGLRNDPTRRQTDKVLSLETKESLSAKGNKTIRADWVTPYRQFSTWHMPEARHTDGMRDYAAFAGATLFGELPTTITYRKEANGFFRILAYNRQEDMEPDLVEKEHAA